MFGVYLPCDDHRGSYAHAVLQIVAYIESVLDKHVGYRCIILGDFFRALISVVSQPLCPACVIFVFTLID